MKRIVTTFAAAIAVWAFGEQAAHAQTLAMSAGAGAGQLWDDETRLGGGFLVDGGVVAGVGDHVLLSGRVDRLSHQRSLTYFGADGQAIGATGRASYVFGSRGARVRPMAGAGLGVMHSTGTLTTPNLPSGQPALTIPTTVQTEWSLTRPIWEGHGGLRVHAAENLVIQPEVRWRSTFGSGASAAIEPPLMSVQGLVSLEWRIR